VAVGVNDLKYRQVEQIVRDYRRVLARLATVPRVFVVPVLPVDPAGQAARERPYLRNQTIEAINDGLRMLCRQQMNAAFSMPGRRLPRLGHTSTAATAGIYPRPAVMC
jgi:hypothetical protein